MNSDAKKTPKASITKPQTTTKPDDTPTTLIGNTVNSSGVSQSVKKDIENIKKIDPKGNYSPTKQ
ncbi:MAG: hypothetical protein ACK481_09170 [Candidatus Melainabacteria bacterium]